MNHYRIEATLVIASEGKHATHWTKHLDVVAADLQRSIELVTAAYPGYVLRSINKLGGEITIIDTPGSEETPP